jgi:leader peptidase (prepilin peptidase)/N-methyltransferase
MLLLGKCRSCGHKIGPTPLLIELAAIALGAISVLLLPPSEALAASIFGWLLLPLIILDYQHYWLPDRLIIPLAIAGLLAGPTLTSSMTWSDRGAGLLAGFGVLEAIRLGFKRWRGYHGMGAGDPKLFGVLGIWMGWQTLPIILLGASAIGLCLALVTRLMFARPPDLLPFGSYLCAAAFLFVTLG